MLDMCLCLGFVRGEWGVGRGLRPGFGRMGWCYDCVRCGSGFSV